jgi:hypothetical protein
MQMKKKKDKPGLVPAGFLRALYVWKTDLNSQVFRRELPLNRGLNSPFKN